MNIYILSPLGTSFFTKKQLSVLESKGHVHLQKEIIPYLKIKGMQSESEKIIAIDPDYFEWNVPKEFIDEVPNVKAILLQSTSFGWIDVEYAASKGIPVINNKGFSTTAAAEWALMMALLLVRKIPLVIADNWKADFKKHQGYELRGKTAGVIGLGAIGTAIAEKCAGLGMTVQYWSRKSRNDKYTYSELSDLMKTSDIIFLALAKNTETKTLLTDELLTSLKHKAIFVSVVHEIYNHNLLLKLVKNEKIYGYGYETSAVEFGTHQGNVWAGPELAWCTTESVEKNAEQWVKNIVNAANSDFSGRVN